MNDCRGQFRLATFNLKRFGSAKLQRSEELNGVLRMLLRYDMVILQQLQEIDTIESNSLFESICECDGNFKYSLAEYEGADGCCERCAVLYRQNRFILGNLDHNQWLRLQFSIRRSAMAVSVRPRNTAFPSFNLFVVHTTPARAVQELNELFMAVTYTLLENPAGNVLVAVDFNSVSQYISEEQLECLQFWTNKDFEWFSPSDVDAITTGLGHAYDRMIAIGRELRDALHLGGQNGVYDFSQAFGVRRNKNDKVHKIPLEWVIQALPYTKRKTIREQAEEVRRRQLHENKEAIDEQFQLLQEQAKEAGGHQYAYLDKNDGTEIDPEELSSEWSFEVDCECVKCQQKANHSSQIDRNHRLDAIDATSSNGTGSTSSGSHATTSQSHGHRSRGHRSHGLRSRHRSPDESNKKSADKRSSKKKLNELAEDAFSELVKPFSCFFDDKPTSRYC